MTCRKACLQSGKLNLQGLGISLSAFSSNFMHENLDPVNKIEQCPQQVDDIWIAALLPEQLIVNLQAVFKGIQNAGFKLSKAECSFREKEVEVLGRTFTPNEMTPLKRKIKNFPKAFHFRHFRKAFQSYIITTETI